jgi:hypothetical protein
VCLIVKQNVHLMLLAVRPSKSYINIIEHLNLYSFYRNLLNIASVLLFYQIRTVSVHSRYHVPYIPLDGTAGFLNRAMMLLELLPITLF